MPLKPLLRLDEGQIILLERTRTRHKALDSLYSFVEDFPHIESLALLYGTHSNEIDNLLGAPRDDLPARADQRRPVRARPTPFTSDLARWASPSTKAPV